LKAAAVEKPRQAKQALEKAMERGDPESLEKAIQAASTVGVDVMAAETNLASLKEKARLAQALKDNKKVVDKSEAAKKEAEKLEAETTLKAAQEKAVLKPDCSCPCEPYVPPSTASWLASKFTISHDPCDATSGGVGFGCQKDIRCSPWGCWPTRTTDMRDQLFNKIQEGVYHRGHWIRGTWHGGRGQDPYDSFRADQLRRSDKQALQQKQGEAVCPATECRVHGRCMCIVADDDGRGYTVCDDHAEPPVQQQCKSKKASERCNCWCDGGVCPQSCRSGQCTCEVCDDKGNGKLVCK